MAYIRQIEESEATGQLERIYKAASARAGSVAKIVKVMGLDPASAHASMQFYGALMKSPNGLSNAQKEMVATVVSNVNECYY